MIEGFGSGDSFLVKDLLPLEMSPDDIFYKVREEVQWNEMMHKGGPVPRLICIQGSPTTMRFKQKIKKGEGNNEEIFEDIEEEVIPFYRHPTDEHPPFYPFSETIDLIRRVAQERCRQSASEEGRREESVEFNHVLIQWYRDGEDYISEHADKTLDIARDSRIINCSLGATRTMVLRTKKNKKIEKQGERAGEEEERDKEDKEKEKEKVVQRVDLPHNSMFVLGWQTNRDFLHSIRQDRRQVREKSAGELAFQGQRISLTFRTIATFRRRDGTFVGQGAPKAAREVDQGEERENEREEERSRLYEAFSAENRLVGFDWDLYYASGFSVC